MLDGSGTAPVTGAQSSGLVPQLTMGANLAASKESSRSNLAPASVGSVAQYANALFQCASFGAYWRPFRYSKVVSSGPIIPMRAPASIDMLQTVKRPSIDRFRI